LSHYSRIANRLERDSDVPVVFHSISNQGLGLYLAIFT
jgi:hypothetical protein